MIFRERRILRSVYTAIDDIRQTPTELAALNAGSVLDEIALLQDDDAVPEYEQYQHVTQPGEVILHTPTELEIAVVAIYEYSRAKPPSDLKDIVRHEKDHARAQAAVGYTDHAFGIKILDFADGRPSWVAFQSSILPYRPVTKLEYASVSIAPAIPSSNDITDIQTMGYSGIHDVQARMAARRIRRQSVGRTNAD